VPDEGQKGSPAVTDRPCSTKLPHARCSLPVLAAMALLVSACATTSASTTAAAAPAAVPTASPEAPSFMFVQSAEALKVDPAKGTFRMINVNQQTVYFSDRPYRIAGHITMSDYLKEWTAALGPDNLGAVPPNATLSAYEAGQAENSIVIVKISQPVVDGKDLVYAYKLIDGKMPAAGGATALFIDKVGVGGGVGAGFHGVGVGGRGPGVR
jgi:hypothetical protein